MGGQQLAMRFQQQNKWRCRLYYLKISGSFRFLLSGISSSGKGHRLLGGPFVQGNIMRLSAGIACWRVEVGCTAPSLPPGVPVEPGPSQRHRPPSCPSPAWESRTPISPLLSPTSGMPQVWCISRSSQPCCNLLLSFVLLINFSSSRGVPSAPCARAHARRSCQRRQPVTVPVG